jgi:F420-0:gamma-glutamyl ligase
VHIKAVADLLGHSSVAITGDIYGHTSDATARAAVDKLSAGLGLFMVEHGEGQPTTWRTYEQVAQHLLNEMPG